MSKSVAILGLSKFGRSIAAALTEEGAEVLVVDNDAELIDLFSSQVTYAMVADLRDTNSIYGLGLENMDIVIVAMSMNLEATIMCITLAKELGVPKVIVKAKDDRNAEILKKLGADMVIQPESEYGVRMAYTLTHPNFMEFFDLTDDVAIIELKPNKSWVGKNLKELSLRNRYGINVIGFRSGKQLDTAINPDKPLEADTQILVVVEKKMLGKITKDADLS